MNGEWLFEKMNLVEGAYINEAAEAASAARPALLRRLGAAAAAICLCLVALCVYLNLNAPEIIDIDGFHIENGVLKSYSGTQSDVVLPAAVTEIADYAFLQNASAAGIESVTITSGVRVIGCNAFAGLENLTQLILEDESTAFVEENGVIMTFDGSMIVKYSRQNEDSYKVPEGVKYIAAHAFQNTELRRVDFCEGLEYIGYNAFAGCSLLEAVYLPESIVCLDKGAFSGCMRAVDGYVPEHTDVGDGAFSSVPFFLSQIAGQMCPLEEIVRGTAQPAEAIQKSDTARVLLQVEAILDFYRTGRSPQSDLPLVRRIENIVGAALPEGAVLPDAVDFSELEFRDNGWGGMGLRDVQIRLPLGDACTLVMEAYLYAPGELLYWSDAEWRIEEMMFVSEEAGDKTLDGWNVTRTDGTLVFYNPDTGAAVRTPPSLEGDGEYRLLSSPDGNRCIVEYERNGEWYFFVQSLDGERFEISMNSYVDYLNRYFGAYAPGTLSWKDNNTVCGENIYGEFEFNLYTVYPKQITDSRRLLREENERTLEVGEYFPDIDTKVRIWTVVPETWVGDTYLEDFLRTDGYPGLSARMSHCDIRSPEGLYHNGEWDEDALSRAGGGDPAQTVLKTDAAHVTKNDMSPELTVYNAAVYIGRRVVVTGFFVYPEDPEDYFDRVILPVIQSFRAEEKIQYFTSTIYGDYWSGFGVLSKVTVTIEEIRREPDGVWLTLAARTGEDGEPVYKKLDMSEAFPYNEIKAGERLTMSQVPGIFWLDALSGENGQLRAVLRYVEYDTGTDVEYETEDLMNASAAWTKTVIQGVKENLQ